MRSSKYQESKHFVQVPQVCHWEWWWQRPFLPHFSSWIRVFYLSGMHHHRMGIGSKYKLDLAGRHSDTARCHSRAGASAVPLRAMPTFYQANSFGYCDLSLRQWSSWSCDMTITYIYWHKLGACFQGFVMQDPMDPLGDGAGWKTVGKKGKIIPGICINPN